MITSVLLLLVDHVSMILYTTALVLLLVGAIGLIAGLLWMLTR